MFKMENTKTLENIKPLRANAFKGEIAAIVESLELIDIPSGIQGGLFYNLKVHAVDGTNIEKIQLCISREHIEQMEKELKEALKGEQTEKELEEALKGD